MDALYYQISSDFSKAIARYIKDNYNIDLCGFITTKNLYTTLDLQSIAMENINTNKELTGKRLNNFTNVFALRFFNTDNVFYEMAEKWSSLDSGIIIIPLPEIRRILAEINSKKETIDAFTDCVIVSIIKVEEAYIMIGDFVTFTIY